VRAIASLDEWLEWAGPLRGAYHWADGRSAREVARAWLSHDGSAAVPRDLQALLNSNAALGPLRVGTAIPELKTPLGDVPSGPRHHDLVLLAVDAQGRQTLVGVEAKADEPFDAPVAARIRAARAGAAKAKEANREDRSAQLPRIDRLARALFGRSAFGPDGTTDAVIGTLPYQLLAGLAGTLIDPAFSPDGKRVVVTSLGAGLSVVDLAGRRRVVPGTRTATDPAWQPLPR
jgi:hypothetical protein